MREIIDKLAESIGDGRVQRMPLSSPVLDKKKKKGTSDRHTNLEVNRRSISSAEPQLCRPTEPPLLSPHHKLGLIHMLYQAAQSITHKNGATQSKAGK